MKSPKKSHSNATDNDIRFLRPSAVAEILDVSEETLRSWRAKDNGPQFIKLGRAVRYAEPSLVEWIYSRLPAATQERLAV